MYQFERESYEARMQWFRESRFGLFIHWGLYAIPARGEWVRNGEQMPEEQYLTYFDEFTADDFDPKAWARAAKEAGMRYAVLTAKHHDGFCLFDSRYTDFKSTKTKLGRDIVRDFLDAFRAEGLRVGLYYSLLDWHHPDYPHYGDRHHPMGACPEYSNENRDFDRYLDYMHGQVRELCENYGKLDILWFDFAYDDMRGEKWRAAELADMPLEARKILPGLQPNRADIIVHGICILLACMDKLGYIHLKEKAAGRQEWDFPALGKGYVPFPEVFALLEKEGNASPFSIEIEFTAAGPKNLEEINQAVLDSAAYLKAQGFVF